MDGGNRMKMNLGKGVVIEGTAQECYNFMRLIAQDRQKEVLQKKAVEPIDDASKTKVPNAEESKQVTEEEARAEIGVERAKWLDENGYTYDTKRNLWFVLFGQAEMILIPENIGDEEWFSQYASYYSKNFREKALE